MNLTGPIVLCGRSTNDTARGYNGRLTHLALFDEAITPLEAYAIYMQVPFLPGTTADAHGASFRALGCQDAPSTVLEHLLSLKFTDASMKMIFG